MLANSLTREVGLKVGPVLLEALIKHYFDRISSGESLQNKSGTRLRQNDILYDEAFTIIKAFMDAATFHTVEELQEFSNTRTLSPPWVHVVRTMVPMSTCDDAALLLIQALGGEDVARRVVGGVKWWQVRGLQGVEGQWITAKKDWREAKQRYKQKQENNPSQNPQGDPNNGCYERDMDELRCCLYLHGGGYYFGSVDQERYCIQRIARKIRGRVFAIDYRLAPQYPFPCAIQDAIAAYLFLIRPPPNSSHRPVNPAHIVIAGDSAGGGLALALLQVIRDTNLPSPAGGILISPWCDLTHSFPSIHSNTDTDIIPSSGLSFHKPSTLWPPPSDEISSHVHATLRSRFRQAFASENTKTAGPISAEISGGLLTQPLDNMPVDVGPTTPVPPLNENGPQPIRLVTNSGDTLEIREQVHFYTTNSLIGHPLVSPALSYLGGLPPMFFVAGDKEVLRDEVIYTAHKAANPQMYPVKEDARRLYPVLKNAEDKNQRTSVHLQVYDDVAHVLPVLFSFTSPAKYCFRAIASFCKFVTGNLDFHSSSSSSGSFAPGTISPLTTSAQILAGDVSASPPSIDFSPKGKGTSRVSDTPTSARSRSRSLKRVFSSRLARVGTALKHCHSTSHMQDTRTNPSPSTPLPQRSMSHELVSTTSSDVGGPRFRSVSPPNQDSQESYAGDPKIYNDITDRMAWNHPMIRERVSTTGAIRPLESEPELDAFQVPPEIIGSLSELAIRRYLGGRTVFDKKYSHVLKSIEKHRHQNLQRAKEDGNKRLNALRQTMEMDNSSEMKTKERVMSHPSWGWAWALDESEKPPPSSIVSRSDTEEAHKLAEIADQAIIGDDRISGNNLWSTVINFFTVTPGGHDSSENKEGQTEEGNVIGRSTQDNAEVEKIPPKRKSRLSRWYGRE